MDELNHRVPIPVPKRHIVKRTPLQPPFPDHLESAIFGKGCFWSVEESFWELGGVYTTAAGYAGGSLEHPTYSDVCGGDTGHAEVVLVVYDPKHISYTRLLDRFWKGHRPLSSGDNRAPRHDQYRSVIFTTSDSQHAAAIKSRDDYQNRLPDDKFVVTEITAASTFFYAEAKHQQYSAKRERRIRATAG